MGNVPVSKFSFHLQKLQLQTKQSDFFQRNQPNDIVKLVITITKKYLNYVQ